MHIVSTVHLSAFLSSHVIILILVFRRRL